MKWFRILSHPYTLIICYLLIMISGKSFGGFYAMYILMGLPFGAIHSLLAVTGILMLIVNYAVDRNRLVYQLANILGFIFLVASLFYFFSADTQHYNWATFHQGVPVLSLIVNAAVSVFFLTGNFILKPRLKVYN